MMMINLPAGSIKAVVESKPAPNIVSGFYPYPQRGRIRSATVESRGPAGRKYRPVRYEMQSVLETHRYRKKGWVGSPYAKNLAVRTKRIESKSLAELVAEKPNVIKRIFK